MNVILTKKMDIIQNDRPKYTHLVFLNYLFQKAENIS